MQKFLAILMDNQSGKVNWQYPNELNGNSKQEIFKLLTQDIPAESISEILTEKEYYNKYVARAQGNTNDQSVQKTIDDISSDQFENGNDFFNAVMETAMLTNSNNENIQQDNTYSESDKKSKKYKNEKQNIIQDKSSKNNIDNVKYFEEGGIKFKLENGVLFKKVWKQVLLNGQKTSSGDEAVSEFRLVSSSTKKLVSVDKVELQRLEWEEVKTH